MRNITTVLSYHSDEPKVNLCCWPLKYVSDDSAVVDGGQDIFVHLIIPSRLQFLVSKDRALTHVFPYTL